MFLHRSRAMAERNALYRKAKKLFEEQANKNLDGIFENDVDEMVSAEIRSSKKHSNLFPGGYVGKTSRISVEDSACNNKKPVCNAVSKTVEYTIHQAILLLSVLYHKRKINLFF